MAITYVKDIPDFNIKVKQVTDISELETTVSQLSASLVTVKGDVTEAQGDITTLAGAMTTANVEIDDIWKSNNLLGAKNLIPFPYYEMTKTHNGITYVADDDGVITASNTATANANLYITATSYNLAVKLKKGIYIASMPNNKGVTLRIGTTTSEGTVTNIGVVDGTNEFEFTVTDENIKYNFIIQTLNNTELGSGIELKPMLRLASYQDGTYTPYAMTNKELTNIVKCNETTNGTYTLKATVSNGVVSYAWTADT